MTSTEGYIDECRVCRGGPDDTEPSRLKLLIIYHFNLVGHFFIPVNAAEV